MLAVTKKLAKYWMIKFPDGESISTGRWVVDYGFDEMGCPFGIVTHQDTLFTMVLYGQVPTVKAVLARIGSQAPWYRPSIAQLYARNGNRRVTGSMNDMKYLVSSMAERGDDEQQMQDSLNSTPFSMLGMDSPNEALAALRR